MTKSARLRAFESWMRKQSISWDQVDLVESLQHCSGLALGVVAVCDIQEGHTICVIPKEACLSIRTTAIADLLKQERLGGGEGTAYSLQEHWDAVRSQRSPNPAASDGFCVSCCSIIAAMQAWALP
jgi:hypothetical protein